MARVTNADLMTELKDNAVMMAEMRAELKVVAKHDVTLYGPPSPGLEMKVDRMNTRFAWTWTLIGVVAVVLTVMNGLTGCQASGNLASAIDASNTQLAQRATYAAMTPGGTETPYATLTDVVPAQPSATPTSGILEITPCGAYVCETTDNQTDIDILARLCVVEVRGFGSTRDDACASVVSTVMARIFSGTYSDGTVRGTLLWNCTPEDCQQFPGYVVNGCDGILLTACPWNYPDDIEHFRDVVDHFARGRWGPGFWCSGYTYYDSRPESFTSDVCTFDRVGCNPFPPTPCAIYGDAGQYEVFHN